MERAKRRLAFVVSHPIQYYVPLYQRLAKRNDLLTKVFFTWHAGQTPVQDIGFRIPVKWDIPLTEGYDFELVPNVASDPGIHHFLGLRNPSLVERVDGLEARCRPYNWLGVAVAPPGDSRFWHARNSNLVSR